MIHDQAVGLRRKLTMVQYPKQAKTIAVVSGKGGVGKSNFALNFSLELINKQKTVLLFDLDVGMGNIDILLGLQSTRTLVDMFRDHLPIHEVMEEGPHHLQYIAAGSGLADFFTLDQDKIDYFLAQYTELVPLYDYIIFDMGAGASSDSLQFLMAADECMVVTTPEPTSITDAYGMMKHIINKKQHMPIYVVMNRSLTIKQGAKALERFQHVIKQFLQVDVSLMGTLPEDKIVTTAVMRQIPYVLLNEKAAVSKAVKQMVTNYLVNSFRLNKKEPLSFVQKLKQLWIER